MEGGIGSNEPLDYIEYQIFPSLSRYEASIHLGNNYEVAASGSLEPLLFHSPQIKALDSKGFDGTIKLAAPEDLNDAKWVTKSTLLRFLQIITSSEVLNATTALRSEISQLEEAHSFHMSLYEKGSQKHFIGEEADYKSEANGFPKDGTDTLTSADSKNELLRAMYLRLIALREELSNAFAKAAIITFSREEINDIEKFCSLFGATDLRKSLNNLVELSQEKWAETNKERRTISEQSNLPVKYGCSPAKLAKIERQNSSESGESSDSSMEEEEQPSVERSRTLIRSASPRRSASPMRRVQIGRSGSRKSAHLTVKSLNYFPKSQNDELEEGNNNSDEATEQPVNARIMSVQDAISLFENKKKDQIQKINSFSTGSIGPKKSVLRRWSTGLNGDSNACRDSGSDNSVDFRSSSSEIKPDHDPSSTVHHVTESTEIETEPNRALQSESNDMTSKSLGNNQKETTSAEWSKQKEAELDELLTKMMETKPVKYMNGSNQDIKTGEVPGEKKGGKRNEKLPSKNGGKQQVTDKKNHGGNINYANGQKSKKITTSSSSDTTKELPKPSVLRKVSSKTSPLPATRKSWPSAPPSTKTTNISPMASAGTNPSRRKSQPIPSVTKSGPTKPQIKETPSDKSKLMKNMNVKNQEPLKKAPLSTTKPKVQNVDSNSTLPVKPSLYSKVTKKNSVVVPLEPKPFLRKGSKIGLGVGVSSISKKKVSSQLDEISKEELKDQILPRVNETVVSASSNPVISQQEPDLEPEKSLHTLNHVALIEDELSISPAAWVEIEEEHEDQTVNDTDSICEVELSPKPRIRQSLSQMLLEETSESELNEWGVVDNTTPTRVFRKYDGPKGLKKLLKFARKSKTTVTMTDGNSTGWSSPSVFSEGEDDAEESKSICKRSSSDNLLLKMATLNNGHQRSFYQDKDLGTHGLFARPNMNKAISESLSSTMQDNRNSASFSKTKATRPFFSLSAFRSNSK